MFRPTRTFTIDLQKPFVLSVRVDGENCFVRLATMDRHRNMVFLTADQLVQDADLSNLLYQEKPCKVRDLMISRRHERINLSLTLSVPDEEFVRKLGLALKMVSDNRLL